MNALLLLGALRLFGSEEYLENLKNNDLKKYKKEGVNEWMVWSQIGNTFVSGLSRFYVKTKCNKKGIK